MHIPSREADADDYRTDPTKLAERGLIKDLTKAQRERIDAGADLTGVLNESRDRWRARMAADRKARKRRERESWGPSGTDAPPTATVHDLFARLTTQVDAAAAMRSAGIAE